MSSEAVPSKFISLVPTNGNQFTGGSGQKIIFELEPSLGYVKGRDSYLNLKVVNNDTTEQQRVMFNNLAGADSIINRVDIYSLKTGQHLETLQNYNQWAGIENQYFYDDKTNIRSLGGVGSEAYAYDVTDTAGNVQPTAPLANSANDGVLSPVTKTGQPIYNYRNFTCPLKCGIFRWWDDERLTPVLNLLGLRIEITLEDPKNCLLNLEAVDSSGAAISLIGDQGIGFADMNNTDTCTSSTAFANPVRDCGLAVGNKLAFRDATGTQFAIRTITAMAAAGDKVQLTLDSATTGGLKTGVVASLPNDTRSYKVEPEFRVLTVAPQNVNLAQGIDYEFTSYDLYFDTLFASQVKHQTDIPTVQTRALAIMNHYEDPTGNGHRTHSSYFSGANPDQLKLDSVQYFIKGRLQPVRAYNPKPKSEKIISEHELVKALSTINKEPQDLGQSDKHNLNNYTNTYLTARELARGNYFYDLSDAEPQLRLGFSGTRTNNHTINTYVWSKKIVVADPQEGLRVIL